MQRFFQGTLLVLLAISACGLLGCASTPKADSEEHERVSTLPWNQPEKWEHTAPLGGVSQ